MFFVIVITSGEIFMKSVIENGVLNRFDIEDLKDKNSPFNVRLVKKKGKTYFEITIPNAVEEIGKRAFDLSFPYVINIPSSVKVIKQEAFKDSFLAEVNFSRGLEIIEKEAFKGCKIQNISLPDGLKGVGVDAFKLCPLTEVELPLSIVNLECGFDGNIGKLCIGGKSFSQNNFAFAKLNTTWHFIKYAVLNKKFLPKNELIMMGTAPENLPAFFSHSKDWLNVISTAERNNSTELKRLNQEGNFVFNKDSYEYQLYKISIILGLFENKSSSEAKNFLINKIAKMKPNECFWSFMDILHPVYNSDFASFVMNNYKSPVLDPETDLPICFLSRVDSAGEVDHNFSDAYNRWGEVRAKYPNKSVMKKRETGSINNNLSVDDVFNALYTIEYKNVLPGNEKLVETICGYGYSQNSFEKLQALYEFGKMLAKSPECLPLQKITPDSANSTIKYELLKKDDPEALILGDETACCQRLNDSGEECMKYGVTSKNSGFIKFVLNDQIVAQSWVWYNEKTKHVCLDNIEIPVIWKKRMRRDELQREFNKCLIRLADAIIVGMNKDADRVRLVSVGSMHTDFDGIKKFPEFTPETNQLPDDYYGYTDASINQYRISGIQFEDLYFNELHK